MFQAASCSAAITHVIKPYEALIDEQHNKYKQMISEMENSEENEQRTHKVASLLELIEQDDVIHKEGKPNLAIVLLQTQMSLIVKS